MIDPIPVREIRLEEIRLQARGAISQNHPLRGKVEAKAVIDHRLQTLIIDLTARLHSKTEHRVEHGRRQAHPVIQCRAHSTLDVPHTWLDHVKRALLQQVQRFDELLAHDPSRRRDSGWLEILPTLHHLLQFQTVTVPTLIQEVHHVTIEEIHHHVTRICPHLNVPVTENSLPIHLRWLDQDPLPP